MAGREEALRRAVDSAQAGNPHADVARIRPVRLLFLSQGKAILMQVNGGARNGSRTCRFVLLGSGKPAIDRQRIVGVPRELGACRADRVNHAP